MTRDKLLSRLRDMQYERTNNDFGTGTYRVRGDSLDINLTVSEDRAVRVDFFGDDIDSIRIMNPISGEVLGRVTDITIFPAKHNVSPEEKLKNAIKFIREDLEGEIKDFMDRGKIVEATRLKQRVNYDLEMIEETGFCKGIENYSRYIDGRAPGTAPSTLLDYFPDDYLTIIDESHISVPQIGGMYSGDRSRKENLVDYGFRMKSALDNRPLKFEEFLKRTNQTIYTSATPSKYELENSVQAASEVLKSGN
jgi:excinuclease ABC subunit B